LDVLDLTKPPHKLDDVRIDKIALIASKLSDQKTAESKNKGSKNKSSIWEEILDIPFECTNILLSPAYTGTGKREVVVMPDNLGIFLRDTAGNDLELACKILRFKQTTFDPIFEHAKRDLLIKNLIFLNALRIYQNISKKNNKNPLKPDTVTAFSNGLESFINSEIDERLILDDIYSLYRFTNFPSPKTKKLKKSLLIERCMLCPSKQHKDSYFCEFHFGSENKSQKLRIQTWIKDAYNRILQEKLSDYEEAPNVFVKAYELHNWAKNHPIHKQFRDDFYKLIDDLYPGHPKLKPWSNIIASNRERTEIEKAYRLHPYASKFNFDLNYSEEKLIDLFYTACLVSEHTLIKIAGNLDSRKTHSFSDVSIKDFMPVF